MTNQFTILHLSDAHIGHPKHNYDSLAVLRPLTEDIGRVRAQHRLTADLVVFSGDIAYGELGEISLHEQYRIAGDWIECVYKALGADQGSLPILFVPGNHDINRNRIDRAQANLIKDFTEEDEDSIYSDMQGNTITWQRLLERQSEWSDFVRSNLSATWKFHEQLQMTTGLIEHHDVTIGIAGLNSSWASSGNSDRGRLWVGKFQLQKAKAEIANASFKILVTHHPPSWLHNGEHASLEHDFEASFNLYLHGHDHAQWYSDRQGHLRADAGPCYAGSDKPNGYSWITLDFEQQNARIVLREYKSDGSGGWGPKYLPARTSEEGVGIAAGLFTRRPGLDLSKADSSTDSRLAARGLSSNMKHAPFADLKGIEQFIDVLETDFAFRWEPQGFMDVDSSVLVYWPVRLRKATPIHAVQCFAASGLQQLGAKVILCIDDLGSHEIATGKFADRIRRWFQIVGGDIEGLQISSFSEVIEKGNRGDMWEAVHSWLGKTGYALREVFEISKILAPHQKSGTLEDLLRKRPRRLLTPALVWACLVHFHNASPSHRILTLGGYDELSLWDAWRNLANLQSANVGHLYVYLLNLWGHGVRRLPRKSRV